MTNEKAIERLSEIKIGLNRAYMYDDFNANNAARELASVLGKAIESLEKQTQKKYKTDRDGNFVCPNCGRFITKGHCCNNNNCRQKIDWSEENE